MSTPMYDHQDGEKSEPQIPSSCGAKAKIIYLSTLLVTGAWGNILAYVARSPYGEITWADGIGYSVLLLAAPLYSIIGFAAVCVIVLLVGEDKAPTMLPGFLGWYRYAGLLWIVIKIFVYSRRLVVKSRDAKKETSARAASNEKERIERLESVRVTREIRAETDKEHRDTLRIVRDLLASCQQPFAEVMRGAAALGGAEYIGIEPVVLADISQLFIRFSQANDVVPNGLWNLLSAVYLIANPNSQSPEEDSLETLAGGTVASYLKSPGILGILNVYDKQAGTRFAASAAAAYRSIALAAAKQCDQRLAVKMVLEEYLRVLHPYLNKADTGSARSSFGGSMKARCEKCTEGFQLLGLTHGVPLDEVESQRRILAQLLHSDRLGAMSEKVRDAGEEQLKSINAACDHIRQCRNSGSF